MTDNFADIRPYTTEEIPAAKKRLLDDNSFVTFVQQFQPQINIEELRAIFNQIQTPNDVHHYCRFPLKWLVENKTDSLTVSGLENFEQPAIAISNHRDIILDAAFLNYILMINQMETTEMGIGDNLLATDWLHTCIRMAKCFIVKRSLSQREMLHALTQLSAYIRYAITEKRTSIWIAQREGRAKNSDDKTQESILKMFAISGNSSFIENIKALNITPLTISYEYDPCDFLKAKEFQLQRDHTDYKKTKNDDVISMKTGVLGYKGRVHYAFSPCINADLEIIAEQTTNRKEQIATIANLIDRYIHANYTIYPINKIAYDTLFDSKRFAAEYSADEKKAALNYFDGQITKIDLPDVDVPFVREKLLEMYANPLKNYLQATEQQ
ncbi:MAG: 1-acyl-sn-glycerol-3-phosphate acyltransferase [Paludibacteraceae bacterium]|nr:1-acyl-sn-glycerol-3-phosphate acyltransferase [Paludibacteraceae bacterium]